MMSEQLSKRHNAYSVLPEELIEEIKKHFPAGTLYIPANGKPAEVDRIARAKEIRRRYRVLCNSRLPRKRRAPVKYLAKEFEFVQPSDLQHPQRPTLPEGGRAA